MVSTSVRTAIVGSVLRLEVDVALGRGGVGLGLGLGPIGGVLDRGLDVVRHPRLDLVVEDLVVSQLATEARQRVVVRALLEVLGAAVLGLLVVRGVPRQPRDLGLDERRAIPPPRRAMASRPAR